jgi:hypothetical protein
MCWGVDFFLEQLQGVGASDGLGSAVHAEFAVDAIDMALHRADGDYEFLRYG